MAIQRPTATASRRQSAHRPRHLSSPCWHRRPGDRHATDPSGCADQPRESDRAQPGWGHVREHGWSQRELSRSAVQLRHDL